MLENKVIIITGASSGIGAALVREFAKKKNCIVLAARNYAAMALLADDINQQGHAQALAVESDVTDELDCKVLIETTVAKFGRIDILINNAGVSMRAQFSEVDIDVMKQVMDINFWGTVYCSRFAMPYLMQTGGVLVGISSIAGLRGLPERCGYSASKFAMHGLFETLRVELLHAGVGVLLVCPGFVATDIRKRALMADGSIQAETPRDESGMMSASEVASRVHKAILQRKKLLILTFEGKLAVWINKWFPRLADKLIYKNFAKEKNSSLK